MKQHHLQNRANQEITSKQEILGILKRGKYAVISMCSDNEPYIVSLSYGYDAETNSLYFHCAKKGLKLDIIRANPLVCATVIEDRGYIMESCDHAYKTIVFWGKMEILDNLDRKKHGMQMLLNHLEEKQSVIEKFMIKSDYATMEILRLDIDHIHGKKGSQ